ncbi:MAG: Flp pilus assembly protein CpaB [Microthrixaceae bacterium]
MLILIGALLVGGLAAFLTLNYVRGVENRVDEDTELVEVVVAKAPINKGQDASGAIAAGSLAVAERERQDVPAGAVSRLADVEGQVAAINLGGGEIVTGTMFSNITDLTGSKSASLDPGNVAVTVGVDSVSVSGGLVKPGDIINLLVEIDVDEEAQPEDGGEGGPQIGPGGIVVDPPSGYLFQSVKVFAVGTDLGTAVASEDPDGAPEEANTSTALTLQMPPEQAALLVSVRESDLFVTLTRPDYEMRPIPLQNVWPSFPGIEGVTIYEEETPGQ